MHGRTCGHDTGTSRRPTSLHHAEWRNDHQESGGLPDRRNNGAKAKRRNRARQHASPLQPTGQGCRKPRQTTASTNASTTAAAIGIRSGAACVHGISAGRRIGVHRRQQRLQHELHQHHHSHITLPRGIHVQGHRRDDAASHIGVSWRGMGDSYLPPLQRAAPYRKLSVVDIKPPRRGHERMGLFFLLQHKTLLY